MRVGAIRFWPTQYDLQALNLHQLATIYPLELESWNEVNSSLELIDVTRVSHLALIEDKEEDVKPISN